MPSHYDVHIIILFHVVADNRAQALDKAFGQFSDELYELSGHKTTGTYWEPISDSLDAHLVEECDCNEML